MGSERVRRSGAESSGVCECGDVHRFGRVYTCANSCFACFRSAYNSLKSFGVIENDSNSGAIPAAINASTFDSPMSEGVVDVVAGG